MFKAPLGRIPLIDVPFQRVAMDLIGPIHPVSDRGHRYILTIVDYATRYPEAVPLANIDTQTVAESLIDVYSRVGVPKEILTDMGTQFTSDLMKEVGRLLSIKQLTTTPYHPICTGLVERFNGTLKIMLKRMCTEKPKDWDKYINPLLFAYRESPNESTGLSPFEILYGRTVRGPLTILRELWTKEPMDQEVKMTYQYVLDLKEKLRTTCEMVKQTLAKSTERNKKMYDRGKKIRKLQVGDKALVLLPTDKNKLLMQWKGPFSVISKFKEFDYQLMIFGRPKAFHINLLKQYIDRENGTTGLCIFDSELIPDQSDVEELSMACASRTDDDSSDVEYVEPMPMPSCLQKEFPSDIKFGRDLKDYQKSEIQAVVNSFSHLFTDVPYKTNVLECEIKLTSDQPIRCKPYPVPYAARESINKEVKSMLDLNIIERCTSPYASPLILVSKKDGTYRPCVDFRKLNKITVFDPEPMPNPEDLFIELSDSKYFIKLDLSKGYWQVPMADASKEYTSFVTPEGQYRFLYMPFGLVNSGADDILIHTSTWEEHVEALNKVLCILEGANLSIKPSKCDLGVTEVEFLGHKVSQGIIGTNPDILKKIHNSQRPRTKKTTSLLSRINWLLPEVCTQLCSNCSTTY